MIALLCATRLFLGTGAASVQVELRRHHDIDSVSGHDNRMFTVVTRPMFLPGVSATVLSRKTFSGSGAKAEAKRFWREKVAVLEGQGYRREDRRISGFHEED